MGYLRQTIRGAGWIGGFRIFSRIVALGKMAILARLLLPAQFGLFGIASLVLTFVEILTETGINVFLIQSKEEIDEYLDTAWVVSIFRGILLSLTIFLIAPAVSIFFKSPDSYFILVLVSLIPLIRGFINPAIIKFQKELQFDKEFWFSSATFLADSFTVVILALLTRSARSFAWGLIAGAILEIILSFVFIKPRPVFSFDKRQFRKITSRGKWITISGIFDYFFREIDDMAVGKFLGETSLGLYQVAYKISTLPITELSQIISKVTFPVFVKISKDPKRLRIAFLKTGLAISAVTLPIGMVIFLFAKSFVLLILGEGWLEVVPVLKILAIFGTVKAISVSSFALFLSAGKQEYMMAVNLVGIIGISIFIFPLVVRFGLVGAGISTIIGLGLSLPLNIYYLWKLLSKLNLEIKKK